MKNILKGTLVLGGMAASFLAGMYTTLFAQGVIVNNDEKYKDWWEDGGSYETLNKFVPKKYLKEEYQR